VPIHLEGVLNPLDEVDGDHRGGKEGDQSTWLGCVEQPNYVVVDERGQSKEDDTTGAPNQNLF